MPHDPDHRDFERLRRQVRREVRDGLTASHRHLEGVVVQTLAESRQGLEAFVAQERQGLEGFVARERQGLEAFVAREGQEMRAFLARERQELAAFLAGQVAENRQQFSVLAEDLRGEVRLLAEGVIGVDQKLDRFRDEVREEFARVHHRLLRLEARVLTDDRP